MSTQTDNFTKIGPHDGLEDLSDPFALWTVLSKRTGFEPFVHFQAAVRSSGRCRLVQSTASQVCVASTSVLTTLDQVIAALRL